MMTFEEFVLTTIKYTEINNSLGSADNRYYENRPRIHCYDGFSFSVQANKYHYCSPKCDPYDSLIYDNYEVGYPSEPLLELKEYVEWWYDCWDTVFGYVPIDVIKTIIDKHKGIDKSETLSYRICLQSSTIDQWTNNNFLINP